MKERIGKKQSQGSLGRRALEFFGESANRENRKYSVDAIRKIPVTDSTFVEFCVPLAQNIMPPRRKINALSAFTEAETALAEEAVPTESLEKRRGDAARASVIIT